MQHTFLFLDILSLAAILWVECGLFYSLCIFPCFSPHFILFPHQFPTSLRAARRLVCFFFLTIFKLRKQMIQTLVAIPKSTKKKLVAAFACLWLNSAFGSLCSMFWTVFSSSFPFCCGLNECPALRCTAWPKSGACQSKCAQFVGGVCMVDWSCWSCLSSPTCQWSCFVTLTDACFPNTLPFADLHHGMNCDETCSVALWDQIFSFLST